MAVPSPTLHHYPKPMVNPTHMNAYYDDIGGTPIEMLPNGKELLPQALQLLSIGHSMYDILSGILKASEYPDKASSNKSIPKSKKPLKVQRSHCSFFWANSHQVIKPSQYAYQPKVVTVDVHIQLHVLDDLYKAKTRFIQSEALNFSKEASNTAKDEMQYDSHNNEIGLAPNFLHNRSQCVTYKRS